MRQKIGIDVKAELPRRSLYKFHSIRHSASAGLASPLHTLAVWLSGNALTSINVVALRQSWLVLG